jgi:hypothetical protein
MTRRENQVRRRPPSRQPRTRVLVVCGGVRTERDYMNGLKRRERNPAVQIKVVGKGLDPESLVRHAVEMRVHASDDFDEIWCVTDVDQFDLQPAVRLAEAEGISLAVSNPCFELWLLYHHEDRRRPVRDADEAIEALRRYVPHYAKNALRMEDYADTRAAIDRGRSSHDGVRSPGPNPSSGVWRLAELVIAG